MSSIKDITDTEQWAVSTTLKERWPGQDVELQLADVEIKLMPHDRELTTCPALFWQVGDNSFITRAFSNTAQEKHSLMISPIVSRPCYRFIPIKKPI